MVQFLLILSSFVTFQMDLDPWLDVKGMQSVSRFYNRMATKCCLSVGMEGIGILAIRCCSKLNMSILLPQFQLLIVTLFGWLTFWLMKRLLGPLTAILLQEYKRIILNSSNFICKVAWLAEWYFSSLLK